MADHTTEQEPLLGRPGDAAQEDGQPIYANFWLGTGIVAQVGIWLLAILIWAAVFMSDLMLFSAHPLFNSAGLLLITQAALVLQPTHTPSQKRTGALIHTSLAITGNLLLLAGLVVIVYNKSAHNGTHFESAHARLGLITYILLALQGTVGFTQYFTPALYGGVDNAKSIYKYHRAGGYVTVVLALAAVSAATWTDFNVNVLHIKHWTVITASVVFLIGIVARVKKEKFGLGHSR